MPSLIRPTPAQSDPTTEYAAFLGPAFDPNQFAHSIVTGSSPGPNGTTNTASALVSGWSSEPGDISSALAKLNFGVDDLNSQLKHEIGRHHEALLLQAASLGKLDGDLAEVRRGLGQVEQGVARLRNKITVPHDSLASSLQLLTRLRRASSLARRAARFTLLARRLESQMADMGDGSLVPTTTAQTSKAERETRERRERAMAEAALTLAEIELLLHPAGGTSGDDSDDSDDPEAVLPISGLDVVRREMGHVRDARGLVTQEMMDMVQSGLEAVDQPLLSSSIQTAHNLSVLPSLIESLMADLAELVARKVKAAFDLAALAREVGGKDSSSTPTSFVYKSRARTEPTAATAPQWVTALWAKLEGLMADLGGVCVKVYTLEQVLARKRDNQTQLSFLDEALSLLETKPSLMFWTTLAAALETQCKEAVRGSPFMQNTLSTGYPRLLRLLHEFFTKIAVHTDTVYTHQHQSPETVLVLRAIQPFEQLYLNRSTNRLADAVVSAFAGPSSLSASFSGRSAAMPSASEGVATARAIVNELDAARFDPLLVKAVARGAARAVETYVAKAEGLVARDHGATSLLGPLATPSQHANAELAGSLYHLWAPLHRALPGHNEPTRELLGPAVERVRAAYLSIADPLLAAIRREVSALLGRMHRVDYSRDADPAGANPLVAGANSSSAYMAELADKLALVRDEVLGPFRVGELAREWALDLARLAARLFVLHASLVSPMGELGKLKLTQDATALEFALSQGVAQHGLSLAALGDPFRALRAFRPMLFLALAELTDGARTGALPELVVLHHALSRGGLRLPHQARGWSETEYVRWLGEEGEAAGVAVVKEIVGEWERERERADEGEGEQGQGEAEPQAEAAKVVNAILEGSREELSK